MSNVLIDKKLDEQDNQDNKTKTLKSSHESITISKPAGFTNNQVKQALAGKSVNSMQNKEEVLSEVKRLLDQHGLTLDLIIGKYKEILSRSDIKFKGSEVVKVLELVSNLHGVGQKSAEQSSDELIKGLQDKPTVEIRQTFITLTTKTQEYLDKLDKIEEAQLA